MPAKWIRLAAAFLEAGLLVAVGAMFLSGVVEDRDADLDDYLPMRVGIGIVPILIVAAGYAIQRVVYQRRFAFVIAGALVCGLGAALRAGIEPLQRLADGLRGIVVGAIVMGIAMNIDAEGTNLLEGEANPFREVFFGFLLIAFGSFPSAIWGGFVLAWPSILMGMGILVRCIRYDAPTVAPKKDVRAALRIFASMLFLLLGAGFLIVCPMISLGIK